MTRYYSRSPSLHLKGHWLEAARFGTDTPVVITVEHGQLLIRPVVKWQIKISRLRLPGYLSRSLP
ncbi:SymE family type I addiction module toxin [Lonsdalea quercina]|uniref:SymE family type I addiction module toxin n=1 Tax=Lonsdalea quercina TaxID=71657 RepID=UPI003974FEF3